jgi:predicted alpha/beta superfamily hydrolase
MIKPIFYLFIAALLCSCKNKIIVYNDPVPKYHSLKIDSKFVNEERVINVYLPSTYNELAESFPVLYMPDGGIKEDFPHIANTISKLIENNKIPPIILVGIENTERGRDLSGFSETENDEQYCPLTDGAKNFRRFISEELMPEINQRYKTQNQKGIIGESLAGLFVMETFFTEPETFDFYIAMDPSMWWNDHYLVKHANSLLEEFPNKEIKLLFAGSSAEDISKYTNRVNEILQTNTLERLKYKYSDEPKEEHNSIFRATKAKALIWTLNKTKKEVRADK